MKCHAILIWKHKLTIFTVSYIINHCCTNIINFIRLTLILFISILEKSSNKKYLSIMIFCLIINISKFPDITAYK